MMTTPALRPAFRPVPALLSVLLLVVNAAAPSATKAAEDIEASWQRLEPDDPAVEVRQSGTPADGRVRLTTTAGAFLYTPVQGDFQLTVRVVRIHSDAGKRVSAAVRVIPQIENRELFRAQGTRVGERRDDSDREAISEENPRWMRIIRKGERIGVYKSWNGRRFKPAKTYRWPIPEETVYAGVAVFGGKADAPAVAEFVQFELTRPNL